VIELVIGGEQIRATSEHPFFVVGQGWRPAERLSTGDKILTMNGVPLAVDRPAYERSVETVYNIEVQRFHSYYVTRLGLLVHNQCKVVLHKIADWAGKGAHIEVNGVELRLNPNLRFEVLGGAGGKPAKQALAAGQAWLEDAANRQLIIDKIRQILAAPPMNQPTRNLPQLEQTLNALLNWGR
jgi:hypothetical protein